ncbi:family 20 glycosylhydrolase [Rubritalea tangerina]|uniref:beta-N-acetylhexosaminidase n=1 Tax=Rubritalea tangerina TaxID=430798 RepID=A0ABW4Z797_9BACT
MEPPHWPGHKPLDRAYHYDPIPAALSADEVKHILGIQGNVWTIFIHEEWLLDISTWPRAAAIAETGWTQKSQKDWDDFYQRLSQVHRKRLDGMGINYWWEETRTLGEWSPNELKPGEGRVELEFDVSDAIHEGDYEVSFNYTGGAMGLSIEKVGLYKDGAQIDVDKHKGFTGSSQKDNVYRFSVPAIDKGAKYTLRARVYGDGGQESSGSVIQSKVETKVLKKLPYE